MKIAFVVGDISSSGGIERVTSTLANFFISMGHDITIISLFRAHKYLQYEFTENIKIKCLSNKDYARKKQGGFVRLWMFITILPTLRTFMKQHSFDIIIGQGFPVNIALYVAGFYKKLIACEHVFYNYYNLLIRKCRIIIYRHCLYVVALTKNNVDQFARHLNNVVHIPNPSPFKTNNVSKLSYKRIISVGRLDKQKGYDMLLHAVKIVFQKFPDWTLDIFGDGILRTQLLHLRDNLGLQNNVFFRGVTNNIKKEYLSSSLYVLSSRYEGFPMVLIEAASCGLPIIAFDCPEGPIDILANDGGIIVAPNDVNALSLAIIDMLEDKGKREQYAAKGPYIASRYTPEKIYSYWDNLFNNR
jgi:glycosyltransferase involved in cell wall biosynthesis